MRDLDAELLEAALDEGYISSAELDRARTLVEESGGKLYGAQVLIRERMITTGELLTLQDRVRASVYECPHCQRRHARKSLPKKLGRAFPCKGCGKSVRLDSGLPGLSRIEVLTSRDPRDLTVTLAADDITDSASDVSIMDLERYEVAEELGRGGYGVVFRAQQRDLQRPVALKVVRAGANLPPVVLERFIREGRAASRLNHPNIVSVYDIGRFRDLFVLAMELVPGKPLKNVLKERGRLPWAEAVALMDQILLGVGHAHANGVVHRDLKPTNIIVEDATGRPRIIDFGLAKDLEDDSGLTQAGAIVGTPFYLSPEQIQGRSAEAEPSADVFALGVILYELLTGERPFSSRLKSEVYALILKSDPKPLALQVDDLPPGLAEVVARAMAKKKGDRYVDAEAMRQALAPFLGGGERESGSGSLRATARRRVAAGGSGAHRRGTGKHRRATGKHRRGSGAQPRAATGRHSRRSAASRALQPSPGDPAASDESVIETASRLSVGLAAGIGAALLVGALGFVLGRGLGDPPPAASEPTARGGAEVAEAPAAGAPRPGEPEAIEPEAVDPEPVEVVEPEVVEPDVVEPDVVEPDVVEPDVVEPEVVEPEVVEPEVVEPDVVAPDVVEPAPVQGAVVPAAPAPLGLDAGERDADEFPELAVKSTKVWLDRAFLLNFLADSRPHEPRLVRGLRLGLLDRFPLNRAFALRGLAAYPTDFLRAYGSQALFENLLEVIDDREPYVARTARGLLDRLSGGHDAQSRSDWRRWWRDEGEALLLAAAQTPPPVAEADPGTVAKLQTQSQDLNRYFSELRDRGLELLICIDVTSSMHDELDRVRAQVTEITSFMDLLLKGKVRMGFCTYDNEVVGRLALTSRLSAFARAVEQIEIYNNPANRTVPEGVHAALEDVLSAKNDYGWRKRAVRTILLLGDAPPGDPDRARELARQAGEHGFVLNALIAPPPPKYAAAWPPKPAFEELAALGGGVAAEIASPEELITQILVFAFGSRRRADLERFVRAYREVTGAANAEQPGR